MLQQRPGAAASEPLFVYNGRPLTVRVVTRLVRRAMDAAGQDGSLYNSHGLRIGGATTALAAKVPPTVIRIMGRWDSDVYEVYCRRSQQVALNMGAVIASTPFEDMENEFVDDDLF